MVREELPGARRIQFRQWIQALQYTEQYLVIGLFIDIVHIHVADDAEFIDHVYGALRFSFAAQHAVSARHGAVRVEIAQQRVGDAAQAFSPGFQAGDAINTDTQDLGIDPIEPVESDLVRWDLTRSYRRPGQGEESDRHITATAVFTQTHALAQVVF